MFIFLYINRFEKNYKFFKLHNCVRARMYKNICIGFIKAQDENFVILKQDIQDYKTYFGCSLYSIRTKKDQIYKII